MGRKKVSDKINTVRLYVRQSIIKSHGGEESTQKKGEDYLNAQFTSQEILDEMDRDMEESGIAQGEIESNLNHWKNKYLIVRKTKE